MAYFVFGEFKKLKGELTELKMVFDYSSIETRYTS